MMCSAPLILTYNLLYMAIILMLHICILLKLSIPSYAPLQYYAMSNQIFPNL